MKRIAIDMDEVIADAHQRFYEWYERDFGLGITLEKWRTARVGDLILPEHKDIVKGYPRHRDFFKDLEIMPDSQEVIEALSKRFEIYITTAAMEFPNSFIHKLEWLNKYFPFISWNNIVFCGNKSIIHADYLIDDNVYHFEHFTGQGILFDAPHNRQVDWPLRVKDWKDVRAYFQSIS